MRGPAHGASGQDGKLPRRQILLGDALDRLRGLPSGSVDCVVTSPPYFRLRDYGVSGQLGLEPHVAAWVEALGAVLAEAQRVLVPTGTLWLNLGDSYSTGPADGAARKSLLAAPERLLLSLLQGGWILRNKIVWAKTNPIPSSVGDRLSTTYEVIYLLTRSSQYYFDLDAIREAHRSTRRPAGRPNDGRQRPPARRPPGRPAWLGPNSDGDSGLTTLRDLGLAGHPLGKNPGDVWSFSTSRYGGAHFATYPVQIVERMLRAGCPEARCVGCRQPWRRRVRRLGQTVTRLALAPTCGCDDEREPGLVLDPFMGSGSTAIAAEALGRDWLGIELNPDYIELAIGRIDAARTTKDKAKGVTP